MSNGKNEGIYRSIITDLVENDPDFPNFAPEKQDIVIDRIAQEEYGIVPETDLAIGNLNFLQKAIQFSTRAGKETGQFIEGLSDVVGFPGKQIGGFLGEKALQATFPEYEPPEEEFEPSRFAGQSVSGLAGAGALAKGAAKAAFSKAFAQRALPKATKKLSGAIQEVIKRSKANPEQLSASKNELLTFIKEQYAKAFNPRGREAGVFKSWIRTLQGTSKKPSAIPENVTADILSQAEQQFGKASAFSSKPSDPILAQSAKEVRRFASAKVDEIAARAGVPQFIRASAQKSKLLSTVSKRPGAVSKILREAVRLVTAGAIGGTIASKLIPRD